MMYDYCTAGNHELGLDPTAQRGATYGLAGGKREECLQNINHCIFLEDRWVKINGIKIYGSPWYVLFSFRTLNNSNSGVSHQFG
jgi:hypothetical protein